MFLNFFKKDNLKEKSKRALRNAGWNLIWVFWLIGIYFAANYIVLGVISLWRIIAPNARVNELVFAQVIIVVMWSMVIGLLVALPKIIAMIGQKRAQRVKTVTQKLSVDTKQLGWSGWLTWSDVGLGITGFVLGLIVRLVFVMAVHQIVPGFNIEQRQDLGFDFGPTTSRAELMLVFVMLVIVVPIVEELIFRGYLYGKIREKSGFFMTMVIVSVIFGLGHFSGGGWVSVVVTAALSVAMCLTREVSKSLYPSIIIHMINNGIAFAALASGLVG